MDLMSVSRFAKVAAHKRYRTVVFTAAELAEADTMAEPRYTERLAGRFCAKEAVAKALGRGFGQGLSWRDIEVTSDRWGAPTVALHRGARRVADESGVRSVELSVTHQSDLVVCVATALTEERS
ncbi:holo-[acyl-carrier protein] synthase [Actinophytocola oryzae]|uniref:Holo-[acyl-carrier protein] synthase n=1 Tax=Actinophytocola oryzae TaxID=502181 RepID=A0A4R7VXF8_9PSEU|nr:holo-[acyl-carrier protein] synthase [Actinophytocola oryzae]